MKPYDVVNPNLIPYGNVECWLQYKIFKAKEQKYLYANKKKSWQIKIIDKT